VVILFGRYIHHLPVLIATDEDARGPQGTIGTLTRRTRRGENARSGNGVVGVYEARECVCGCNSKNQKIRLVMTSSALGAEQLWDRKQVDRSKPTCSPRCIRGRVRCGHRIYPVSRAAQWTPWNALHWFALIVTAPLRALALVQMRPKIPDPAFLLRVYTPHRPHLSRSVAWKGRDGSKEPWPIIATPLETLLSRTQNLGDNIAFRRSQQRYPIQQCKQQTDILYRERGRTLISFLVKSRS
jgi:hypothetical protein